MEENKKGIFKQYWYQISVSILIVVFILSMIGHDHYQRKFWNNTENDFADSYGFCLPDTADVKNNLALMKMVQESYVDDVNKVADVINKMIAEKKDLRSCLKTEEKKLSAEDLQICYSPFQDLVYRYTRDNAELKYPNSVVDSLATVLLFPYVFNKK